MSDKTITTTITHRITLYDTGVTISNTGAIEPSGTGSTYSYDEGAITGSGVRITNDGTILGSNESYPLAGIYLSFGSQNTIVNNGVIRGGEGGFGVILKGGTLINSGTIAAVYLAGTLINSGLIIADNTVSGVELYDAATIINSGTINGGGGDAVKMGGQGALIVEPGAVFVGAVAGQVTDVLEVEGTSATELLGVGTSFDHFGTISFAVGAAWTVGGDAAGLAAGQTINGLNQGDTIVLDGFAANTNTYIAGTGLILSNGMTTETLDITGHFSTGNFIVTDSGYTTDITADVTPPSTISGTVTVGVTLGAGGYDSPLTVTSTGTISPAAGGTDGVYGASGTVVNQGSIAGSEGAASTSPAQAGGVGVVLIGATLTNAGIIAGGQGGGGDPGGGAGGAGVSLSSGAFANGGTIIGGTGAIGVAGGVAGDGLDLSSGSATNSGTIMGGIGGAAMYGESGALAGAGVRQDGASLTNSGTIAGGVSDTAVKPGQNGYGLVIDGGATENHGLIEGGMSAGGTGALGVYMVNGDVTNDGRIFGGAGYIGGAALRILGGTLINQSDGGIEGGAGAAQGQGGGGIRLAGPGTVENFGVIGGGIGGTSNYGVILFAGSLMNAGVVNDGLFVDAYTATSGGTVTNAGTINDRAFVEGGTLNNAAGGIINGGLLLGSQDFESGSATNAGLVNAAAGGVGVAIGYGNLVNTGSILGGVGGGSGASIFQGDIDNSGLITGGAALSGTAATSPGGAGVYVSFFSASVLNTGTILGGSGGIYDSGGDGMFLDRADGYNGGLIEGGFGDTGGSAVYVSGGTFTNAGTLDAGQGAIPGDAIDFGDARSTLIADPGAVFDGAVIARAFVADELDLGTGASGVAGTLDMGGSFSGFSTIVFDVGANWHLAGSDAELAGGQKIAGFSGADTILLENFTATSNTYIVGGGLDLSNGAVVETLDLFGGFSTSSFVVTDTAAGTKIQLCYLAGTRILTPAGERAIETLQIGDTVITRFNGYRRVRWIGRQSFARRFVGKNRDKIPVRILAGALGPGLPQRDLSVSPGHSMLIGGVLVLARNLVNGITVRQDECPEEIFYYQLEFETHDCVMAEGVWSESFCDFGDLRHQFHNVEDFYRLYPGHVTPTQHLLCAPRPEAGLALETALRPLTARAAGLTRPGHLQGYLDEATATRITGWAQDITNPELPVLLEVFARERLLGTILACDFRADLAAAGIARGRCAFTYAPTNKISRSGIESLQIRRAADGANLLMGSHCQRKTA